MRKKYDYIILGAGIYGLYAAKVLVEKGYKVAVLEHNKDAFTRASYVNQARVHKGYHYPKSFTTAMKCIKYFDRFSRDFYFAINKEFKKIYGIAKSYSLTSSNQFKNFCKNANIPCTEVKVDKYFNNKLVESAFETEEFAFDAIKIKEWFLEKLISYSNFSIFYNIKMQGVSILHNSYCIKAEDGYEFIADAVINATYASINQVIERFGYNRFDIKYELCEIVLCNVSENIKDIGLTLMDGPFFSVMPFGLSSFHSLTSVNFTHHKTSLNPLPSFPCQKKNNKCSTKSLENCNECEVKPETQWIYMKQLSKKYLQSNIELKYVKSIYSIKPILKIARHNDSRPTIIVEHSKLPKLISVLSGKINTIYDLDEVLI